MGIENPLAEGFYPFNKDRRVRLLIDELYDAICRSERFSWVGLFKTDDRLAQQHFMLYLEDIPAAEGHSAGGQPSVDIVPPFLALHKALHPRAFVHVYYTDPTTTSDRVEDCLRDIASRFGVNAKPRAEREFPVPTYNP